MDHKNFPNITIKDQNNHDFDIMNIKNKFILLYFYPKDMTPGCTAQAIAIKEAWEDFVKFDCQVIGISKDTPKKHTDFIAKYNLPFTLLSDTNLEISKYYGTYVEKSMFGRKYMGIERSSFLLDADRRVLHQWLKVKPASHAEHVLSFLDSYIS